MTALKGLEFNSRSHLEFYSLFIRTHRVWGFWCFFFCLVLSFVWCFFLFLKEKAFTQNKSNSSVIAFMHTQLFRSDLSSTQRITSCPSAFSYRACYRVSCLQLYPLFLHQLPLIAIFKSVLKAHKISQMTKFFSCPFCQSISVMQIPSVGRFCTLSPSSRTSPSGRKKQVQLHSQLFQFLLKVLIFISVFLTARRSHFFSFAFQFCSICQNSFILNKLLHAIYTEHFKKCMVSCMTIAHGNQEKTLLLKTCEVVKQTGLAHERDKKYCASILDVKHSTKQSHFQNPTELRCKEIQG